MIVEPLPGDEECEWRPDPESAVEAGRALAGRCGALIDDLLTAVGI